MHIENFKVFCDLVESQSFSKSAKLNNVTQSAVSQQLRVMETHFNSLIIDRSQKQFRLTREGAKVYEVFKSILCQYEDLKNDLLEMKKVVSGDIRISTIYSIGLHELPSYLKDYMKKYPSVNVHVEYRRSNLVIEDVLSNSVDLGFVAFQEPINEIEFVPFKNDRLVLVVSPSHPLAKKSEIEFKELEATKYISFDKDIPTRKATDELFKKEGLDITPVMEFDNTETVKRAVEIDAGVSLLPESTVIREVSQGQLVKIGIKDQEITRPLFIIHRKGRSLSPAKRRFIDLLSNVSEKD